MRRTAGEPPRRRQHHARQRCGADRDEVRLLLIRSGPVPDAWLDPLTRNDAVGEHALSPASGSTSTATTASPLADSDAGSAPSCTCTARSRPASSSRLRRRDEPGPRMQRHADLRQRRRRHGRLRPDVPRRPDARLGSMAPTCTWHTRATARTSCMAGPAGTARTSSASTSCRRRSTRRTPEVVGGGDVVAAHTLTLDGQAGTDTYVINTTGSQPCLGRHPDRRRDLPQLHHQRSRHGRAGRRLRRPDRQRLTTRPAAATRRAATASARPTTSSCCARSNYIGVDPDIERPRTSSRTTRRSSRYCTATSAPRPRFSPATFKLCFVAAARPGSACSRPGRRRSTRRTSSSGRRIHLGRRDVRCLGGRLHRRELARPTAPTSLSSRRCRPASR